MARNRGAAAAVAALLCAGATALSVTPTTTYLVLAGTPSTISVTGSGFTDVPTGSLAALHVGDPAAAAAAACSANVVDAAHLAAQACTVPAALNGTVFLSLRAPNGTVVLPASADTAVATALQALDAATGCPSGGGAFGPLLQPIHTGQTLVGQVAPANGWAYYAWVTEEADQYRGGTYEFIATFGNRPEDQPLGLFVKYTDIFDVQPPLPNYVVGLSPCPNTQCALLTNNPPVFLNVPCGFDGRLLACNDIRYLNNTGSIFAGERCVTFSRDVPTTTFRITSKFTRSGLYVLGVQGQGPTPETDRVRLGYCQDCVGYQNPVDVTFSITVVSGASRAVAGAGWLMAAILATIFASACC